MLDQSVLALAMTTGTYRTMLAIIISACMVNDPNVCRDYKIQLEEAMDATQCAMHAAPYFVPWAEEHPGWEIKRWHCGAVSEDKI